MAVAESLRMGGSRLTLRLLDALHTEALLLNDEARAYFDGNGRAAREALAPAARVEFACESLKLTARLMQVMTWLLDHRAALRASGGVEFGATRLGVAAPADETAILALPREARQLVEAAVELHARVARLDRGLSHVDFGLGPARSLISRLESAF